MDNLRTRTSPLVLLLSTCGHYFKILSLGLSVTMVKGNKFGTFFGLVLELWAFIGGPISLCFSHEVVVLHPQVGSD